MNSRNPKTNASIKACLAGRRPIFFRRFRITRASPKPAARNRRDAEIRLSRGIAALSPIREHDLGDLALGGWRVFAQGLQLPLADSAAEGDDRLADDHGFAVHGSMPGLPAMAQEDGFFGMINQIVEARRDGNRCGQGFGASVVGFDVVALPPRAIALSKPSPRLSASSGGCAGARAE